jgi:hypothetical protein
VSRLLRMGLPLLCLVAAGRGAAGDLIDTRLSFVFADDNVLAKAGETRVNSPNARFGATCQNALFFDNVNTRFCGFETLSHVVLYRQTPAFFPGLVTEAAMALLVLEQPSGGVTLRDDSSYIRLAYTPPWWDKRESISLTGFPVSADRFRIGYTYRLSWGGSGAFTSRAAAEGVPGVRLQVTRGTWYAFAGAKTALILNDRIKEKETNYGLLYGGGLDITPELRVEAGGGYFQKGLIPSLANLGLTAPATALGWSGQVVYHVGMPIGVSVDLRLYRNDPEMLQKFFTPESYPGGLSYAASLEGSWLVQSLEDPDQFGRTVAQPAYAAVAQAKMKWNLLRANVIALFRTLSFIQFEVPGIPPFVDFPDGTVLRPEMFVSVGADYHFPDLHLTPGAIVGVQQPASYRSPQTVLCGNNPAIGCLGSRTVVVREVNTADILPTGEVALPIWSAKGTMKWDISESVASIGEVYYTFDPNKVTFKDSEEGVAEPTFENQHGLGFNIIVQARF